MPQRTLYWKALILCTRRPKTIRQWSSWNLGLTSLFRINTKMMNCSSRKDFTSRTSPQEWPLSPKFTTTGKTLIWVSLNSRAFTLTLSGANASTVMLMTQSTTKTSLLDLTAIRTMLMNKCKIKPLMLRNWFQTWTLMCLSMMKISITREKIHKTNRSGLAWINIRTILSTRLQTISANPRWACRKENSFADLSQKTIP